MAHPAQTSPATMIMMRIQGEIISCSPLSLHSTRSDMSRHFTPSTTTRGAHVTRAHPSWLVVVVTYGFPSLPLRWVYVGYSAAIDAAWQRPPSALGLRPAAPLPPPVVCAACHGHPAARPLSHPLRLDLHRRKRGSAIRSRPLCWLCLIPAIALRIGGCWLHLGILGHGTTSNGLRGRILGLSLVHRRSSRSKGRSTRTHK